MAVADAVVIGAGPNGLVAANLLVDAGWDVVVLEANPSPGGAVRSAQVTAPGFVNDLCSAFFPLVGDFSPLGQLELESYGLSWRRAPATLAHVLPDGRAAVLGQEAAATAASVGRFAKADGDRWLRAYDEWCRTGPGLLRALFAPFPPVRPTLSLLRQVGLGDTLRLARRMVMPSATLGEELFQGEGARLLLAGCAMHTDLSPAASAGGGYGWLLAMLGQQRGFPVPVGGAGRLTDALVARLVRRGGLLRCDAPVRRIAVRGGRAVGVRTADGGGWRVRRAVIADVAAPVLYRRLLDRGQLPRMLLDELDAFRYDGSTVKADWALSAPVPWRDPAAAEAGTVHLGVDLAGLSRVGAALDLNQAPEQPYLVGGQMSVADASRSPAGTETLWAYTHLPFRTDWPADVVAQTVARMEAAIEAVAPGFTDLILARHVSGPGDLEAENANLVGGAIGGGTAAVHQQLIFRPVPGLGRADTPVDGLYLASSSAHPGGGVHGGPGANAARAALARRDPLTGPLYGLVMRSAQRCLYGARRGGDAPQDRQGGAATLHSGGASARH